MEKVPKVDNDDGAHERNSIAASRGEEKNSCIIHHS